MAGATAATAAGVTSSQASAITINLVNNYISSTGGNHLNADLTGDGHPDLTIANSFYHFYSSLRTTSRGYLRGAVIHVAEVSLNGVVAAGYDRFNDPPFRYTFVELGSQYGSLGSLMGSIPIFFKDLHINGGAPTQGSLEVTVFPREILLDSFTYTSNTSVQGASRAVPDQGSSLALLAMGAGGVLALRRWRAAQGGS